MLADGCKHWCIHCVVDAQGENPPLVGDPGESIVAVKVTVHHRAIGRPPVGAHRRDLIVPAVQWRVLSKHERCTEGQATLNVSPDNIGMTCVRQARLFSSRTALQS